MVFGFHAWADAATRHAGGADTYQSHHRHHHKPDVADVEVADGPYKALNGTAAAAAAAPPSSPMTAGGGPHVVLNNGHAIKHLAIQRGYATAPDGVRLFYEVFDSHALLGGSQPAAAAARASGGGADAAAPEPPMCFEVRATAGPHADADLAAPEGALFGGEEAALGSDGCRADSGGPHSGGSAFASLRGSAPGSPIVVDPAIGSAGAEAAAQAALAAPAAPAAVVVQPAAAPGSSPTRGSGGGAALAVLPTEDQGAAAGAQCHQRRRLSSCAVAEAAEPAEGDSSTAPPRADAASPVREAAPTFPTAAPAGPAGLEPKPVAVELADADAVGDVANVLLIMGFAAGRHGWLPLIHHWAQQAGTEPLHRLRARFCVYDNRGIGDSDSPPHTGSYSTAIMARDALAVMDRLGWQRAHVVGFSMGGMIALRLAVAAPQRLASLTALSVTNGGWQVLPTRWRSLKLLLWAAAARTPRQRAHADVHFHFSRETLHAQMPVPPDTNGEPKPTTTTAPAPAPANTPGAQSQSQSKSQAQRVEAALIDEYVATARECAPQPHAGLMGQLHAVWQHGLSAPEQQRLRHLGVPLKLLHGAHDAMALPAYGERIARHAGAAFISLNGGHFIARECAPQVCMHIADNVASARKLN